jgi:hypothetical protein
MHHKLGNKRKHKTTFSYGKPNLSLIKRPICFEVTLHFEECSSCVTMNCEFIFGGTSWSISPLFWLEFAIRACQTLIHQNWPMKIVYNGLCIPFFFQNSAPHSSHVIWELEYCTHQNSAHGMA